MSPGGYHLRCAAIVAVAVLLCGASWVWAHSVDTQGKVMLGYWIGVAGSALPAVALAGCQVWLIDQPAAAAGARAWVRPLLWLSVAFLGFMVLFPLM
jgi:hypothetical protein